MANKKCKKCGVPLEGLLSKVAAFLGIKPSEKDPSLCNKCDGSGSSEEEGEKKDFAEEEFSEKEVVDVEEDSSKKETYDESGDQKTED